MKYHFLLLPLLLAGCSQSEDSKSNGQSFNSGAVAARAKEADSVVAAQNGFGARLLSRLAEERNSGENLLVSPTSAWQALALTASGARGATQVQTKKLLSLGNLSDDQIGKGNRAFNAMLGEQKGVTIMVANSVWFNESFHPSADFVANAKANFGATVDQFAANNLEGGTQRINEWVGASTKNEISQIVQSGDLEGQSAVLVNAVYFRGGWESAFEQGETASKPFHLESGARVEVPMMNGQRSSAYLKGKSFEGVRLPYKNTSCALWVLLPKKGKAPVDAIRELGEEKMRHLTANEPVMLSLPRFEIEWRQDLKTDLAAMGAPLLFRHDADLSGMGEQTAGISAVLHVCKMRVDEEGTVAAAASAVDANTAANGAAEDEVKVIKFDRPFVVALVEETSGARLFEGVVNNPQAGK